MNSNASDARTVGNTTANVPSTDVSPSSPQQQLQQQDLVASLRCFLHAWTGDTPPQPASATEVEVAGTPFSSFPPPLTASLPRSFRPCEMIPGLYLGSAQDIGNDAVALLTRLRDASASTAVAPQQMTLLVRACPLHGVTEPQLELHVARARKTGVRGGNSSSGGGGAPFGAAPPMGDRTAKTTTPPLSQRPARLASTGDAQPLVPVHDVEVTRLTVSELHQQLCAAVGDANPRAASGAVAQWLSPSTPNRRPSLSTTSRGAVPLDFSTTDWAAFVLAAQDVLLGDYSDATMAAVPTSWTSVQPYWRLMLPLLDMPSVAIQPYFGMTTLLVHATLSLSAHPRWPQWQTSGPTPPVSAQQPREDGENNAANPTAAAAAVAMPCVVVHCLAGKSRSVTFVAAFILQEWMLWYRAAHPPLSPLSSAFSADQQAGKQRVRHDATPRRLVDTVMGHLRTRRLCVNVNIGFDGQLVAMMNAFVG